MKHKLFVPVLLLAAICACHKKNDAGGPGGAVPLRITSFAPTSAASDSLLHISGTGFSKTLSDDVVLFGDKPAVVTAVTDTSLTVKVPPAIHDAKISVRVGSQSAIAATDFTYVYTVTTLAGSGVQGYLDAKSVEARFSEPSGVALDGASNVFVADNANDFIRKITPDGNVTAFAGVRGISVFLFPNSLVVDAAGNVFVADDGNHKIQKITPDGHNSDWAGSGRPGTKNGTGTAAEFNHPGGITLDKSGNLYIADTWNGVIRKIDPTGVVTVFAGDITKLAGFNDGPVASAKFFDPIGVAVDDNINVYVADYNNHRIRKISPAGIVSTLAGTGEVGFADGPGAAAKFDFPAAVAVDAAGNVYVADRSNHRIRKITPDGTVSTLAGASTPGFADGAGPVARFYNPSGIAVDKDGTIYVADAHNQRIRKMQ